MLNRLEIGITNTSYGVYGFEGSFAKISEHGYECIDYQGLADINTDFFKSDIGEFEKTLKTHREYIESHGLRVTQAHGPWPFPENHGEGEGYKTLMDASKKAVYGAHVLGSTRLVVHPLMPFGEGGDRADEVFMINERFLSELSEYAVQYGVIICLENLPFKEYPLSSPDAVISVVDKVAHPNLKICLDTGHGVIFDRDLARVVRNIGSRLETVHIHDNMGEVDQHLIPGDGIIKWDEFAAALKEIGYDKIISIETSPKFGQFPEELWEERGRLLADISRDIAAKAY